ncbi:T9SS type A sorting domain-containing protein [Flavilitoribacter nigricans]|uniref:Secretion system C-terminal sorting domain-containing protein n=1 Tax=Flavilitoribacter nigricans (strain ATCC 23147 / DSM 23189 / NBRC 102662 / NCIMB 1420 / SS-2) TaxID=1122177 RepID=A0A2D0N5J7_FLAN2|nr:T9SS type A sorting domain-containing protein [Flavilitoribacter nigricans]PHN03660.1 hypothetical protein CRP01_25760 [Flavilitoribacter nigricans DSM 23189 = NBRC 102662]
MPFSLQAQDDSPCECVQRWDGGAHWNEDGSIDDAPNAPKPLGVIRCANAAETQSQIKPNGCTYKPSEFSIDVSGSTCIDPSTGETVTVENPTEGEPIIWFNFDVRPHSNNFEVQINDNSGDKIGFALYYSADPTSGVNEDGFSGDCSNLVLVACGVESSNTWNTLPVPDFEQPTNYYLAIWDQDADGDLSLNNFKARFGCSEETPPTEECTLELIECPETAKVSCGDPFDPITLGLPFDPSDCPNLQLDYKDIIAGICAENFTIKRLWTFKDNEGNMTECEQIIEFVDEVEPVIEEIEDYTLEDCEAEWPTLSTEWSDNCGSGGQVDGVPGEIMVDGCMESRVYTFTISDDCGNTAMATTTVTRKLDELVVACPGDKTIDACASQEAIDAAFADFLEAFKVESGCNASGMLDAEYSAPDKCGGSVEVSYTASADCGDPQTCKATFTVPECTTGECGSCPEACLISGDQLVCPNEIVVYTVDIEDACENPEIIWSLNETYNDATIVSQDGASITLKIDNNCEGWVELIATIKCEGCEDVVCKYPIDVVLTDIVFETPENVVIDACTDAMAIETAFEEFLEEFSVSGGCNAMGEFEKEYSLPEVCGGSIEIVYNAVADCGQVSSTSATFTIEICEEGSCKECPESCSISGDQLVCPGEIVAYTVAVDEGCENPEIIWSLNETYNDATIVSTDGNTVVLKIDDNCDAWVELIATTKCDGCEPVVCKYPIDVVLTDLVLDCPMDVELDPCSSQEDINAAFGEFMESFSFTGGCDAEGDFDAEYSAPDKCGGTIEVSYTVTESCGDSKTCKASFTIPVCTEGSCDECPESCAISGDQLVCPGEIVTYTVAVEEGCENAQVIWSLNETYNDATIVGEDPMTNSVVLKIDDNCDAWVELIATIKCDGCEDVVCKYPIDVVLTQLTLDCPDDVVLEPCSSQEDIDAAFGEFLESFSFTGGCDAEGDFDAEYSAPDKCGGIVEVSYTVTESCGESKNCKATFKIGICEDGTCNTCEGECLISGDMAACPSEELVYTIDLDGTCEDPEIIWMVDGDAEIIETGDGQVTVLTKDQCEGWFKISATVNCDNCPPVVCEKTVDIVIHKLVVQCPDDVVIEACASASAIDEAFEDFLDSFGFSGACNSGMGEFETEYSAPDKCGGSVTVKYIATDDCGQYETCSATFTIETCEDGSCDECPESCAISGDQLVCPGEIVTYTVAVEEGCENAQVIWSLNETYNDATIVGEDPMTNSVVLKIDDNCDAWVELIATIKCDGCEDVVCKYPIDVVLTDLVLDCPMDVELDPCSSQEDITAAFGEFLESFSFTGGCDAEGDFDAEYSAPDKCGGTVEVSYTVTESCGESKNCKASFTVPVCTEGSCDECPESCAISGDQLVCPGEIVVYTVAVDEGCENPEIIWSLNETYNDATIVSTDGNTVVLKIDDNCDAWVELIATTKCDGCEPVVCKYPIDVVLTQLTLDCPADVVLEPCSSQEDIDAAFGEFLESFSFTGGCDAEGDFDAVYSAPDKCGGIVEVSYTVTESCGESKNCKATFKIGICEDGTCNTCEGECLISGDIAACPNEELVYTLDLDGTCAEPEIIWTIDGDAEIIETGDGQVTVLTADECEGWYTLKATIKCDNCPPVVCEKTADIVRHKLVVECPDDVAVNPCLSASEIDAAFAEFLESFGFSGACGTGSGKFAMEYSAPDACGESVTVKYIATDACGQYETCTATFSIKPCEEGDCGECPEACSISGDQLVCPGEIVVYTVAVDAGCENPEIIWSLNETYNDATIVSTDGNTVVLKIDDNCDAWVELIATTKCDGCEPVVCKYPIDVVLTQLTLDCPDDVVLEPCSSQEDIDAAFGEFLESFSFTGGCDAKGEFDAEYSAPNKCGGIVEVSYTVTESCGESKNCKATFKIGICEDGSCNTCEGSCLIDGKMAACPNEELVYTLDLDGTCAEPEIIWTIDGDAEITATGDGQVTVLATDECEGWFTLKATIKCDNCPLVYCEKTVDIVRHKLVVECPDDVAIDPCLTPSEVNAAFAEFLESFGFSGGCGTGMGDFDMEYSAPEACGEYVTVKYVATDDCGQYEYCTATFSIKACDQACTPEIKDLEDITLEECGAEWPTLKTQWWDDCGGDGQVVGVPGEIMTIDDCYQYRIYTFTIHNDCGEDAMTTTKVTRRFDETPPFLSIPNLNIELVTCIEDIPTPEGLEALVALYLFDNCDEEPTIMVSAEGSPECIDGSFSYTYTVKVCDECGNCDEISVTYGGSCYGTPGEEQTFCTLTPGGWGNAGGKYPWKDGEKATTTEIITGLMDTYGDVIIGDTLANVLRITDPECIISLLPAGGSPDVLPEGDVSASSDNDCTPYTPEHFTGSGRLKNTLAGHAISLQLNIWYTTEVSGSELGELTLESLALEGTEILPDSVETVSELLAYVNLYLGGTLETSKDLSGSLTDLISSINEFFDGCTEVAVDECGLGLDLLDLGLDVDLGSENEEEEEEEDDKNILETDMEQPLRIWPNPASKQLTLNFDSEKMGVTRVQMVDPSGKYVFDGEFPVTKGANNLVVPIQGFPTGIYTIITIQENQRLLERVVITKD